MVLLNNQYRVTITVETMPPLDGYTVLHKPEKLDLCDYYSARLLKIEPNSGHTLFLALVDLVSSFAESCAVLENDILTVIQFSKILRIDLRTGTVVQRVDCDNMGGLEQIHPINPGYIIKGECDIFRYDPALTRVWHFCARDIFASPTDDVCFWIDSGIIHCRDWQGWHYMLDLNGNLISETLERSPDS